MTVVLEIWFKIAAHRKFFSYARLKFLLRVTKTELYVKIFYYAQGQNNWTFSFLFSNVAGDMEIFAYFYGPIGILLCVNILLFLSTARQLTCGLWKRDDVKSTTER
jgi:hypothetical protein